MNAHRRTTQFEFEQLERRCLRSGSPTVTIDDVAYWEGDGGQTGITFIVQLSEAAKRTVQIPFATADGTATVADNDYVARSGTLKFSPGETAQGVIVYINGDLVQEPDETFFLVLGQPKNATLGANRGTGIIRADDTPQPPPPPPPPGEEPPSPNDEPVYYDWYYFY